MRNKVLGFFLLLPLLAQASYIVKIDLTEKGVVIPEKWNSLGLVYGNWTNDGDYYNCQTWRPFSLRQLVGVSMTQKATCDQNQIRIVNEKQQNPVTKATREVYKTKQTQKVTAEASRTVQGTRQPSVGTCDYSNIYGQYSFALVSPQGIASLVYKNQTIPGFDATQSSITQYNGKTYSIGVFMEGSGSNEVYTTCSN